MRLAHYENHFSFNDAHPSVTGHVHALIVNKTVKSFTSFKSKSANGRKYLHKPTTNYIENHAFSALLKKSPSFHVTSLTICTVYIVTEK